MQAEISDFNSELPLAHPWGAFSHMRSQGWGAAQNPFEALALEELLSEVIKRLTERGLES